MARPVVHFEFWTRQKDAVVAFYRSVFDWDIQTMPMPDGTGYDMVMAGGDGIGGGIFEPAPGPVPAKTALYIDVPALAPALERIRAAGGTVLVERQDVPGMGAIALFQDPEGRVNGLWEPLPAPPKPAKKSGGRRKKR